MLTQDAHLRYPSRARSSGLPSALPPSSCRPRPPPCCLFGTGAIFPLGLAVAHQLGERLVDNPSPLAALMGRCVLVVNVLWAVHLTVFALVPTYLPLTIGIGLGLHWIVFGWIIDEPVGLIHAASRIALVTTAWWLMPTYRISAVAVAVVATYAYTLYALATRPRPAE